MNKPKITIDSMKQPDIGQKVIREINIRIENWIYKSGGSVRDVAHAMLSAQPGWYIQTPEGEYLSYLAQEGAQ